MKRTFLGLLVSVAMTGTMVAAQDGRAPSPGQMQPGQSDPARSQPSATESTITGCLVQGSGPTVFLLQDAKMSGAIATAPDAGAPAASASASAAADRGATYRLDAASGKSVDFKTHLNHQVSITGKLDGKADAAAASASAAGKVDEKTLAKFSATSITKLADTCSAVG